MARPRQTSAAKPRNAGEWLQQAGRVVLAGLAGPAGQQILALVLIALGIVTFITLIPGVNSGDLIGAWARALVFVFGWAAYPMAAIIAALGLLWLRHLVHRVTAWRWRPILGFELALVGLQTLTYVVVPLRWELVESGKGGGVVGWALCILLDDAFGLLITGVILALMVVVGVALAFDVTRRDLEILGHRLSEVWQAWRADRAARRATRGTSRKVATFESQGTVTSQIDGVAISPISRSRVPTEQAKAPVGRKRDTKSKPKIHPQQPIAKPRRSRSAVNICPLTLLAETRTAGMDPDEIERKSHIIEETLEQFGVPVEVTEVRPGPTVTQFGVSPGYISRGGSSGADGGRQRKVRVSQIASLSDDLALSLAARSLRVEAPVPGRAVVGIEVPNAETSLVGLRAVLESDVFHKCGKPLCFAVGLDVAGTPIVADLSRMPHLLVAGTTGSGKSVFVKALTTSLVMHNPPEALRIIAIDPKIVELSRFNGLPHLLGSAETEVEHGLRVLRWVAHEMDERYKLFAKSVARNLDDYNAKLARRKPNARGQKPDAAGQTPEPLPRIVVLIDELADLMMTEPEETERVLTRIAQMARATGIHLVVATQRPSTDVVTGLIKANFPARVSFATASGVDSRVIIDTPGAETLLGNGDMLFLPPDASAPQRVQGCFIAEEEIEAVIGFWQQEAGATPAKAPWEIMAEEESPAQWRIEGLGEDADLLEKAIAYAKSTGKVSTSGIQRQLRISYPRAARLMEQMEKMGLVEPQQSAGRKRRVILGGEGDTD